MDMKTQDQPPGPRYLLPREAYLSQEWFDREQELLFGKVWTWIGFETDCAARGQYVTGQAGSHPLFVIRGENNELRAFYNICRHRGAMLLEGKGTIERAITCFYHRWTYTLDGALRAVPQQANFPCLDKGKLGLRPAACATWNGMVFVHPDEHPQVSLDDWIGEFAKAHGPWNPAELELTTFQTHEVKANWKLYLENHIDGLHLLHLHSRSIEGLDHSKQTWRFAGPHYTFKEPRSSSEILPERAKKGSPTLPLIPSVQAEHQGSTVHMMFPNVGLAGGASYYAAFRVVPLAPDHSRVETWVFTAPLGLKDLARNPSFVWQALRGPNNQPKPVARPSNPDGDFVGEDVYAAESLQRSLRSSMFKVGPLSRHFEESIEVFHQHILNYVKA
jgi:phenylpropionate dioxygenase-like ring-hydroxylating dioxygenase large terminal subunit